MALTADEAKLYETLKQEGGDEWNRFRARRNSIARRKNLTEEEAIKLALEPVMQNGDVISINRNAAPPMSATEISPAELFAWARIAVCAVMLILTTGYQIYAQRTLYAAGNEGLYLAALLDLLLVGAGLLAPKGWALKSAKWAFMGFIVLHMALAMDRASQSLALDASPELTAQRAAHARETGLFESIPRSRVSERLDKSAEIALIEKEIARLEHEIKKGHRFLGTGDADVKTRVRWINLAAQLLFSHLLGVMIAAEIAAGTLRKFLRAQNA
jgi:hypothetical protein